MKIIADENLAFTDYFLPSLVKSPIVRAGP